MLNAPFGPVVCAFGASAAAACSVRAVGSADMTSCAIVVDACVFDTASLASAVTVTVVVTVAGASVTFSSTTCIGATCRVSTTGLKPFSSSDTA